MVRYVRHLLLEVLGNLHGAALERSFSLPRPQRGLPVWEVYDVAGLADV